jgi:hypothetical protein
MPGHIKLTKGQVDPDPTEFLVPNIEMKRQAVPPPCNKQRGDKLTAE